MNLMSLMSVPRLPVYTAWPARPALPPAPLSAGPAARYVPPPLCHAWGLGGDIQGVVQRDAAGVCLSLSVYINGDRERFDVERIPPSVARELATRLVQQANAWDREFGAEVRS